MGDIYNLKLPLTGGGMMSVALNDVPVWRSLLRNITVLCDDSAKLQVVAQTDDSHHTSSLWTCMLFTSNSSLSPGTQNREPYKGSTILYRAFTAMFPLNYSELKYLVY